MSIRPVLYDATTCVLSCALQSDTTIQMIAMERKENLEVIEEYPMVLCEVIGAEEEALPERQLAATFLKMYLEELYIHKRQNAAFFETDMGKDIALQLLDYLDNGPEALKPMISYNLALFLGLGFWDTLTLHLTDMAKSVDPISIHNAVFILAQAIDTKFFISQQNYNVGEHWFSVLLDVFKKNDIPSVTRVYTMRPMYVMMQYVKPDSNFVQNCWTQLSEEIEKALNEPYSSFSDFQFKAEILKFLNKSTDEFDQYCNTFVPPSLPAIGNLLTICCEQYKKIVKGNDKPPSDESEGITLNPTNFYDLVGSILEFIYSLVDTNYFDLLIDDLDNLLYYIFVFMACHTDMDRFLFVDSLDKDYYWSVRDLCCQILTFTLQKIEERRKNGKAMFFKSMHNIFQRLNNEIEALPRNNSLLDMFYVGRLTESMIFGLCLVKERYTATDPEFVFPLAYYIDLWTGMMGSCTTMLQGRILWMSGIFCSEMSATLLNVHLKAILRNLNFPDKYILVPSAEALCNYLKAYDRETPEKKFEISRVAKDIMMWLIAVARDTKDFPLHHSLNALGYFIKSQEELASSNIDNIEDILIKTVTNHFADTFIMKEVNFIVAKLAQNQSFKSLFHDKFLTFVQHVVQHLEPKEMRNDPDKALDILNTYFLYASSVDDFFILQAFRGAATLLNANTDRDVELDESAGNLLITLLVKFTNKLKFIYQMPKGEAVIDEFPRVLENLLEPEVTVPENFFGKLVITTIFSFPEVMVPHFETILRNVITGCCKNPKNVRGTWSIFAFICMIRTSDTLSYLSVLPGPNGGSALNFIMKKWVIDYIPELEAIERKILVLSLTQIIKNCLESETDYAKIEEVCVPFDQKPNEESPTGEVFNGLEYMYYLLIESLLFEDKLEKIKPPCTEPYDFCDFGEDMTTRSEEDNIILFHNHPFNINIINHIVSFLKTGNDPYFTIVKKFVSSTNYFKLRDLGCNVPEINIQEDME